MHKGIDLSARPGTRIFAAAPGVVTWSGWKGGYGYCIIIDHKNGMSTLYGHCSKLVADVGDYVRAGEYIAEVGSTGASTGPHLHFEVHRNGVAVDPMPYLPMLN
jgi:murein DD-endopeptidase MepM/ murein hydrolase activator NlpD